MTIIKRFIPCLIGFTKYFCKHYHQVFGNCTLLLSNIGFYTTSIVFLIFQIKFSWWKSQLYQNQFFLLVTDFRLVANIPISTINTFRNQVKFILNSRWPYSWLLEEAPRKENRPLELDDEQIRIVSGRTQIKTESKKIKFLSREGKL